MFSFRTHRHDMVFAARLFEYKVSLTVADSLILFVYAPTQFIWLSTFWVRNKKWINKKCNLQMKCRGNWFTDLQFYGGDCLCRLLKFLSTFGFHLTANIQVLVALDRLFLTAKMNRVTRIVSEFNHRKHY